MAFSKELFKQLWKESAEAFSVYIESWEDDNLTKEERDENIKQLNDVIDILKIMIGIAKSQKSTPSTEGNKGNFK